MEAKSRRVGPQPVQQLQGQLGTGPIASAMLGHRLTAPIEPGQDRQAQPALRGEAEVHQHPELHPAVAPVHHRQAAAQVTVGNIITSMRLLSALDWRDFFESVSCVDAILAQDPSGEFSKMDFATRDSYRHSVESMAKRSDLTEPELCLAAVEWCRRSLQSDPTDRRRSHVGYPLV